MLMSKLETSTAVFGALMLIEQGIRRNGIEKTLEDIRQAVGRAGDLIANDFEKEGNGDSFESYQSMLDAARKIGEIYETGKDLGLK